MLDVETGDRPFVAGEGRIAVQRLGQLVDARSGALEREAEIALAFEPAHAEQLAEALLEVNVRELQLRLEVGACRRFREPEGAFDHAAEGLRFPDCDVELPPAQVGRYRRAPELGIRERDAGRRQAQVDIHAVETVERDRFRIPAVLAAGHETDGRDVGCQVEPLGRKRALQCLAPVECQHAFAAVAVELHVDARESDGAGGDVGARLEREAAEAAARRRLLADPTQRLPKRLGIGGERPLHLERRPVAHIAVEGELDRGARDPDLESGPVALQGGHEIVEADRGVERLVMPGEAAGGCEAAGDRGPGERQLHVRKGLDDFVGVVAQDHGPVLDPDLRERGGLPCGGLQVLRQGLDVAGPVRAAVGIEDDRDGRLHQRHVGDLDASGEQWEKAQPRHHALRGERRRPGAVVAEAHVIEAYAAGREQ